MNETLQNTRIDLTTGLEAAWVATLAFVPKFLLALVILLIGYLAAKLFARLLDRVLEKIGFDGWVERGGIKNALARTGWDASSILAKMLFYAVMLFTLQLAFGVFGPNPVSDLLTGLLAFMPHLFVALVIIVIAGAVATAVKTAVSAALGGLPYGPLLARLSGVLIMVTGVFAALDQVGIAPFITTGLFYAVLAIIAGSAIIAIGGGGIGPMRQQWERMLGRVEDEAPRLKRKVEDARKMALSSQVEDNGRASVERTRKSQRSHYSVG